MNVRNCRNCGRLFNYISGIVICPACKESLEAKFQEVKEYIREHKGAGIQEVAEACDVETAQIRQWLREERLEVTENSALFLNCESCGTPIRSGRYCAKCKTELTRDLNGILKDSRQRQKPAEDKAQGARMRFI